MKRDITNIAASVHQRLLNIARASNRPFGELLQYYAIERFMYRLSSTTFEKRFILKGALMFPIWLGPATRPTKDIDLLGTIENSIDSISNAMKAACRQAVVADGMAFDEHSIAAERITEQADYEGVRVHVQGILGNARVHLQIDVGFGDVVFPAPVVISYPTILDFPSPTLKGYTRESVIAEKFEAMVKLGDINSRMKDFYDIWYLSRWFAFDGPILSSALQHTFTKRGTEMTVTPGVLESSFASKHKAIQWNAFMRKTQLKDAPVEFSELHQALKGFLEPVYRALVKEEPFMEHWEYPGPWK